MLRRPEPELDSEPERRVSDKRSWQLRVQLASFYNRRRQHLRICTPNVTCPMRALSIIRLIVLCMAVLAPPTTTWGASAKDVFAQAASSVVVVLALDEGGEMTAQGSGVVVGTYEVVTNCHVLERAAHMAVRQAADWFGGVSYRMTASLLARDEDRDLCLLFVKELPLPPAAKVAHLGAAKALSVGEEVFVVGAPAGLEMSLSRGIVSQLRGAFGKRSAPLIQTDAAISPGSSGGGLFNQAGELVGITTYKRRGENLNFAMPAEWVAELRQRSRPELNKATARATCLTSPNYECAIELALQEANSNGNPWMRSDQLRDIAETQAELGDVRGGQGTLRTAASVLGSDPDIDSDIFTLEGLARIAIAQSNIGDTAAAKQTFVALQAAVADVAADPSHPSRYTALGYLAAALSQSGQVSKALEVVSSIDEGDRNQILALAEIAQAQAESGSVATAIETALSIDENFLRNGALLSIADMQAKAGDYTGSLKTVMKMDDAEGRELGPLRIATWQLVRGDYMAAEETITSTSPSGKYETSLQLMLGMIQAKKGDFAAALAVADRFDIGDQHTRALHVALLNDVAVLQANAGLGQSAKQTLESALNAARRSDLARSRAILVSTVAVAQAKTGDLEAASRSLAEAEAAFESAHKMDPSDSLLNPYLSDFAGWQAEAGFSARGIETALGIRDEAFDDTNGMRLRVSALVSIARHLSGKPPLPWWYPRKYNFFWVWD